MRTATLFAVLSLALSLAACRGGMERMQLQEKALPYESSALFPDDRAMRMPPDGTVPRERELGSEAFLTGRTSGRLVDRIPLKVDRAMLERGRLKFQIACAPCHGELGDGQSRVASNMSLRPPPSLYDFRDRPDGFFFEVVEQGFGVMPSYAYELPPRDAWAVVAYVRALQVASSGRIDQAPADVRAKLEGGTP